MGCLRAIGNFIWTAFEFEVSMSYEAQIFDTSQEIPVAEWFKIVGNDPWMDIRFLESLEVGWGENCRFWPILIWNAPEERSGSDLNTDPGENRAVAAAILCEHQVDAAQLGQVLLQTLCRFVRVIWPGFLKLRVLVCGVPVSGAQSSLRIVPDGDVVQVADALQRAMRKLAWKRRSRMLIVKEMSDDEAQTTDVLKEFGFIKASSLATNVVECRVPSFSAWTQTLRAHYRYKLRRSTKKFDRAGLTCEHLRGTSIVEVYTPRLHQMYLDVIATHDMNFEVLPYAFFVEFASRMADNVCMTLLRDEAEIVAFSWSILSDDYYQNLLVGFDYERNEKYDLYFNLMMRDLAFGYEQGVSKVLLGQTSDVFKSRLGASQERRWFYVRTIKPALWVMKVFSSWLFPVTSHQPPVRDLYKSESMSRVPVGT